MYDRVLPIFIKNRKSYNYDSSKITCKPKEYFNNINYKNVKIAFVCDEMTYKSFKCECNSVYLTPTNWFSVLEEFKPDIFFCESAWNGIEEYKNCWRGKIYKNKNILFNNRRDLFNILDYCKRVNIKTVFWNKEDPFYFDNEKNNFSDTALYFDYIFTTCVECEKKYKELGHNNVHTLMFGFSEKIFNPLNSTEKNGEVVFAGSWFGEHKERCKDMIDIFRMIKDKGIKLKIYDRNFNTSNPLRKFPNKFASNINPTVPFEKLKEIYIKSSYVININSSKHSETMFARRVFEIMACNTCIISNESKGMRSIFESNVWFFNDNFNFKNIKRICAENAQYVLENHTNTKRLKSIYDNIGIEYNNKNCILCVIYTNMDIKKCKEIFKDIDYKEKKGLLINNNFVINIEDNNKCEIKDFIESNRESYFIVINNEKFNVTGISKVFVHFSYLEDFIGISLGEDKFKLVEDTNYYGCVFKGKYMKNILYSNNLKFKKYTI
ncbi:glycosyltransferase [Clostridium sp. ZBS4]|uniref:CgeB family protein n=1 Tax=Clostridium sp. ZBS4 TaxID=2949974 RepID=UPI002079BC0B|nr:glycosyltransferase [Clostridium sp. ZBS4]